MPLLVAGLWGGALADHVDRKKMLVGTGAAQVVLTALLALNAFRDEPHIWVLFVVAPFLVSAGALQRPSKEALLPRTVRHDQLPAANALNALGWQTGSLGHIDFDTPPPAGAVVTAGFEFDVPVRFAADRVDMSIAGWRAGELPSVPLVELRED